MRRINELGDRVTGMDRVLRYSPAQLAANWINKKRVAVLAFHGVDDPDLFAASMDAVRLRCHPISIDQLADAVQQGKELPQRSVLITFDDGHRSVLEQGLPILEERGLPGVVFVIAGLLSTNSEYWWSTVSRLAGEGVMAKGYEGSSGADLVRLLKQVPNHERLRVISEMQATAGTPPGSLAQLKVEELDTLRRGGIAIGNHTWSHPCLNRCDPDTVAFEIGRAHETLHEALGEAPRWFAYPNGDWDRHAEGVLTDLGYELAFLFDHRLAETKAHRLRLSRLRVNSDTVADRFSITLSGLHPAIHHGRGRE
jgi:peptidoglycan/xylan/chitin deacetylase (PgdA/CDA1 family)